MSMMPTTSRPFTKRELHEAFEDLEMACPTELAEGFCAADVATWPAPDVFKHGRGRYCVRAEARVVRAIEAVVEIGREYARRIDYDRHDRWLVAEMRKQRTVLRRGSGARVEGSLHGTSAVVRKEQPEEAMAK